MLYTLLVYGSVGLLALWAVIATFLLYVLANAVGSAYRW